MNCKVFLRKDISCGILAALKRKKFLANFVLMINSYSKSHMEWIAPFFPHCALPGNCDCWHLFQLQNSERCGAQILSLNAARTEQGSSERKKLETFWCPASWNVWIMPSSGLALCCLLFILLRSLKLPEHPMKSGGLMKKMSHNRERYRSSLALSRDGKLEEFGLLSRARREESRCCRSWEAVWEKGEPHEIDRMQENPWGLVPCVLEYCDVVLWSWKEKKTYLCLFQRHIRTTLRCSGNRIYILKICAFGDDSVQFQFTYLFSVVRAWLDNNVTPQAAPTNQFFCFKCIPSYSVGYKTYHSFLLGNSLAALGICRQNTISREIMEMNSHRILAQSVGPVLRARWCWGFQKFQFIQTMIHLTIN